MSNHGSLACETIVPLRVYSGSIVVYYSVLRSVTVYYGVIMVYYGVITVHYTLLWSYYGLHHYHNPITVAHKTPLFLGGASTCPHNEWPPIMVPL